LLSWQVPLALQVSGLSQSVSLPLPQVVPASSFGCVQTPAAQTSLVQSFPSVVQAASSASWLT